MKRFYCNGKKDFCQNYDGVKFATDCNGCQFLDGSGGEEREVDASGKWIYVPCEVGDEVFVIRKFGGKNKILKGKVSEMYFSDGMRLCIVVKGCTRGEWRKTIFPTYEEAEQALAEQEAQE